MMSLDNVDLLPPARQPVQGFSSSILKLTPSTTLTVSLEEVNNPLLLVVKYFLISINQGKAFNKLD